LTGIVQQGAAVQENLPLQQGMITVLFEKDFRGVRPALLNLNRQYQEIIHTSFCAQMAGELGIEIILVRGENSRIRSLERELMGRRGVRSVRLMLIPS
jgi:metal-responsive CopG/Arc/MetJ family transcriptional regulator